MFYETFNEGLYYQAFIIFISNAVIFTKSIVGNIGATLFEIVRDRKSLHTIKRKFIKKDNDRVLRL
jgi:hypothetical protein